MNFTLKSLNFGKIICNILVWNCAKRHNWSESMTNFSHACLLSIKGWGFHIKNVFSLNLINLVQLRINVTNFFYLPKPNFSAVFAQPIKCSNLGGFFWTSQGSRNQGINSFWTDCSTVHALSNCFLYKKQFRILHCTSNTYQLTSCIQQKWCDGIQTRCLYYTYNIYLIYIVIWPREVFSTFQMELNEKLTIFFQTQIEKIL